MGNSFSSQDHFPFGRLPGIGHFLPGMYNRIYYEQNLKILTSEIVKIFAFLFSSSPFKTIGIVATFLICFHFAFMYGILAIFEITWWKCCIRIFSLSSFCQVVVEVKLACFGVAGAFFWGTEGSPKCWTLSGTAGALSTGGHLEAVVSQTAGYVARPVREGKSMVKEVNREGVSYKIIKHLSFFVIFLDYLWCLHSGMLVGWLTLKRTEPSQWGRHCRRKLMERSCSGGVGTSCRRMQTGHTRTTRPTLTKLQNLQRKQWKQWKHCKQKMQFM